MVSRAENPYTVRQRWLRRSLAAGVATAVLGIGGTGLAVAVVQARQTPSTSQVPSQSDGVGSSSDSGQSGSSSSGTASPGSSTSSSGSSSSRSSGSQGNSSSPGLGSTQQNAQRQGGSHGS